MYVGGKLNRLINDNFFNMVKDSLDQLHWFDPDRRHAPIRMIPEPLSTDENVKPNLITLSQEDIISDEMEMGSNLAEHRYMYYIDVYAESTSLGLELAGDVKDILQGRFDSIARTQPTFDVYDLSQPSAVFLFSCEIEDIQVDRNRYYNKAFEKHWYVISCDIVYSYRSEYSNY